jgi:peptide/nickel transport system substrate-binding protein
MRARLILLCFVLALAPAEAARHFRWASQGDATSMDPQAQSENVTNQLSAMVYEELLQRDKKMDLVPWLATSYENPQPTKWVFHLRKGVKFHDGTPFTADDVVFSFERAKTTMASFKLYAIEMGTARRIDDYTVEFTTPGPNPVAPSMVANVFIMSKAWCEKNNSATAQDMTKREETFASLHANGTGPFILVSREPGVKTTYRRNPDWWGTKAGLFEGNVDTVEYRQVDNAATREAALRSGELDFILDPPLQDIDTLKRDPALKVWEGQETRIILAGLDQARDELLYSTVKGKNPFKDVRVRRALYLAIDTQAMKRTVMRGLSVPSNIPLPDPKGTKIPDKAPRHDVAEAKKLLAEAGYPNGFGFTITCPNNRYINDEKICTALAGMWAKIGLDVKVEALPRAQFFPKATKLETTAFIWGWGSDSPDAIFTLKPVLHSLDRSRGMGTNNVGNYKNDELDELIDRIGTEMDMPKRQQMIDRAIAIVQEQVLVMPLHRQMIPWASRAGIQVVHRPNNQLYLPWVVVEGRAGVK